MNMHSLNRLFLFIMTLALNFNVAAMEPAPIEKIKGKAKVLIKSSRSNEVKKMSDTRIVRKTDFTRNVAPTAATNSEKKHKSTQSEDRPIGNEERASKTKGKNFDGHPIIDIKDGYFEEVTFKQAKFYPPKLDERIIIWDKIIPIRLSENTFMQCDFTGADMRNIEISKCYFELSPFNNANLAPALLAIAKANNISISNEEYKKRARSKITSCKFVNLNFEETDLHSVIFDDVEFYNVKFIGANLKHVIFENCYFRAVEFIDIDHTEEKDVGGYVQFQGCFFGEVTFDLADFYKSKFENNGWGHGELEMTNVTVKFTSFFKTDFGTDVLAKFFIKKGALVDPADEERIMAEMTQEKERRKALKLKKQEEQPAPESEKIIEKEITKVEISVQDAQGVTRQRSKVVRSYGPAPVNPQPYHVSPEPLLDPNILPVPANSNYVPAPVYNSPQPYQGNQYPYVEPANTNYVPAPVYNSPQPYQGNQYPYVEPANTNYVPAPAYPPQPYQGNQNPYSAPAATNYGPTYGPSHGTQPYTQDNYLYNQNVTAHPYGQGYGQTYPQENKY